MQAVHVNDGESVDFIPETDVAAGDVVVFGELVAVATSPIAAGARGSARRRGGFNVRKDSEPIERGARLWWNAAVGRCHSGPAGESDVFLGFSLAPATADDIDVLTAVGG